jgi:hypothetical protein
MRDELSQLGVAYSTIVIFQPELGEFLKGNCLAFTGVKKSKKNGGKCEKWDWMKE